MTDIMERIIGYNYIMLVNAPDQNNIVILD